MVYCYATHHNTSVSKENPTLGYPQYREGPLSLSTVGSPTNTANVSGCVLPLKEGSSRGKGQSRTLFRGI